jgi:fumarylpyruvate hydrolase
LGNPVPSKSDPFFFQKPTCAIVDTTQTTSIKIPRGTTSYHYEAELILAIGKSSTDTIPISSAREYICGVGVGCDFTRRDLQNYAKEKKRPWDDSKGIESR